MKGSHRPRKRFGQNFLQDSGVIQHIFSALAPKPNDLFVEIGPGLGALTDPLLEKVDHLEIIELDRDLAERWKNRADKNKTDPKNAKQLIVHQQDALQFDFSTLIRKEASHLGEKIRVVGNLPYNISTAIIFHLLQYAPLIQDMHFMVQKEVGERIAAEPNSKAYGRLSIMVQYFCKTFELFPVSKEAFYPKPKVESIFLRLVPYSNPPYPAQSLERLKEITLCAFNQRRKTIHNSLKRYLNDKDFEALGIDPGQRPEQLTVKDFVSISDYVGTM